PARPFPGRAPGLRVLCRGAVAEDGWPPVKGGIPAMPDLDLAGLRRCRALATGVAMLAATMAAAVAATQAVAQPPALTGSATYRERIALPPDAAFEATVRDVTRADRPAELIGRTRIEPIQGLPIRFAIPYDPNLIKLGRRYTLQARIVAE